MKIDGKDYSLHCDLNVLEQIQEEFESVAEFERKLIGVEIDEESKERKPVETSYQTIRIAAYLMINEAIEIANEDAEKKEEKISMEKVGRAIGSGAGTVAEVIDEIHKAFEDCFKSKNE